MGRCRHLLIVLLLMGTTFSIFAQLNRNNLVHYSEMDGTIIYDILNDRLGNIWLATQNGLTLFDGYDFKRFYPDPNDSTSISTILIYSLYEDRNGMLWIGGMDQINVFNPYTRTFKRYEFAHLTDFPEFSQPGVTAMAADPHGNIYFGITSGLGIVATNALVWYDPVDDQVKRVENPDDIQIQNILQIIPGKDDTMWFVGINGLFMIDKNKRLEKVSNPPDLKPNLSSLNELSTDDWDEMIWISANNALINGYSPSKKSFYGLSLQYLFDIKSSPLSVNTILKDSGRDLLIGSNQGLIFYDSKENKFETFGQRPESNIERAPVYCLQVDSFRNLWIGTSSNGLLKYNNQTALRSITGSLDEDSPITPGWANNIIEASNHKIWFTTVGDGTNYSGLNVLDPFTFSVKKFPYRTIWKGMDGIFAIIEDRPGEFIISGHSGIFRFYPGTGEIRKWAIPGLPDSIFISKFYKDRKGNFWILTDHGPFVRAKDGSLVYYNLREMGGSSTGSNQLSDIYESDIDGAWLLTNDGLFHYDYDNGKFERHGYNKGHEDLFITQDINAVYEGKDSILWVGTWLGGLSRYDPRTGNARTYTTVDGLPSMSIQGIIADEKNNVLWLSTFEGLSRFSIDDGRFNNFSLEDGIQSPLFADASCLKTSGGLFIFGGINGITFFNPDEIERNSMPPRVFIKDFKVADISLPYSPDAGHRGAVFNDESIRLKFFQNNISINYVGIHFANPQRNRFAYKLENYDESWREVGSQRTAYYYNLPAGEYVFKVRAANSNGIWNEEGASVNVMITPPWWKSWWAYLFYSLLLILILFSADRMQRRRVIIKERAMIKDKELKQAREIERAYRELQTTQQQLIHAEKLASLGELTAGIAHEIQNPLNFVNNFSEVSVDLLKDLETEISNENKDEAIILVTDLKQNLQKIGFHGKRASSIIKGMLEHSRANSGSKENTDLNLLALEYIRLAYHGFKAKDKSFNGYFMTDFDEELPQVRIIPQDIGRVLLNLFNNAFYAVATKSKQVQNGYSPTVTVSTKQINGGVEIRVKDNGEGIPEHLVGKIFQPFFTTKPTGEGTGLGLSLSYDIVTKGHQGEMKVNTQEGEGTEFIISLPG